jgi:hypothetical protein
MLRPMPIEPVPHETARVVRAMLPTENRDRQLANARETLFTDVAFLTLFPTHGQPALPSGGWHSSRAAMRRMALRAPTLSVSPGCIWGTS